MKIRQALLTFVATSDPYAIDPKDENVQLPGPVLTLLEEREYDIVHLFYVPSKDIIWRVNELQKIIKDRGMDVFQAPLESDDPVDYSLVTPGMKDKIIELTGEYKKDSKTPMPDFDICISSGTPTMQASWVILAYSGIIEADLVAVRPRYLPEINPPYSYDVDLDLSWLIDEKGEELVRLRAELERCKHDLSTKASVEKALDKTSCASDISDDIPEGFDLAEHLETIERHYCALALERADNNATKAAEYLGLKPHTFRSAAERLGLRSRRKRDE